MRCNSPSPRPAAVPPPSPPPMSLGFVRGFTGTMRPSDFSSACMPIVRLLPSWVRSAGRTRMRSPKFRREDVSTCMGSPTARGSSSASHLRGEDVAFRPTERRQHLGIRPVSLKLCDHLVGVGEERPRQGKFNFKCSSIGERRDRPSPTACWGQPDHDLMRTGIDRKPLRKFE